MKASNLKSVTVAAAMFVSSAFGGAAMAQSADMILTNGKIITQDENSSIAAALAMRDGNIAAVGTDDAIKKLAGSKTVKVDLGGRTVIPGLIDSHTHSIRSALTFAVETDWSDIKTLDEGLKIIAAAARAKPGAWIVVAGGWHEGQIKEQRGPTSVELAKAAPDNPVYVQHLYDYAVLNPKGMELLDIGSDAKLPPAGKLVRDGENRLTGVVRGNLVTFNQLFARVSNTTFEGKVESTKAFFKALNRVGLTGIVDAAGGGMAPQDYEPLFRVAEQKKLSIRVGFYLNSIIAGKEAANLKEIVGIVPSKFADDKLTFIGLGEVLVWGMHDGPAGLLKTFTPKPGATDTLREIAVWAAEGKRRLQIHASSDSAARQILDIFEEVNSKAPIGDLRWIIAHIENATPQTFQRMKKLGMGWAVQDRLYFEGDVWPRVMGNDAATQAPPISEGIKAGLIVAGGTDGPRLAPYNPFVTLEWLVTGKTVKGTSIRSKQYSATREQALRIHTFNSAWMAGDENKRGTLEPGKWADLVVLSDDYLTVPENNISKIKALMTIVGGKVEHATGPFTEIGGSAQSK
jgi:predicted amidohydrolase YtcJ